MLAVRLATLVYRQSSSPLSSSTPTAADALSASTCRTPPTSATIADEYPASSPPAFHCNAPLDLSSETSDAPRPPGITITRLPSINGDSLKPQWGTLPPYFLATFSDQIILPLPVSR